MVAKNAASGGPGVPLLQEAPGLPSYSGTVWMGTPSATQQARVDLVPSPAELETSQQRFAADLHAVKMPEACWRATPTDDATVNHFIEIAARNPNGIYYPHAADQSKKLGEWRAQVKRKRPTDEVRGDLCLTGLWLVRVLSASRSDSVSQRAWLARRLQVVESAWRDVVRLGTRSARGGENGRGQQKVDHVTLIHRAADALEADGQIATPARVRKLLRHERVRINRDGEPIGQKVWRHLAENTAEPLGTIADITFPGGGSVMFVVYKHPAKSREVDDKALAAILRRRRRENR